MKNKTKIYNQQSTIINLLFCLFFFSVLAILAIHVLLRNMPNTLDKLFLINTV